MESFKKLSKITENIDRTILLTGISQRYCDFRADVFVENGRFIVCPSKYLKEEFKLNFDDEFCAELYYHKIPRIDEVRYNTFTLDLTKDHLIHYCPQQANASTVYTTRNTLSKIKRLPENIKCLHVDCDIALLEKVGFNCNELHMDTIYDVSKLLGFPNLQKVHTRVSPLFNEIINKHLQMGRLS